MKVPVIVRSVHGLEWVCAAEVAAAFAEADRITMSRRQVEFRIPAVDDRLLELRCADDAFLRVGRVDGVGTAKDAVPELARRLSRLEWRNAITMLRQVRGSGHLSTFDCVVSIEGRRNYNRFAVETAAGNVLAGILGYSFLRRSPGRQLDATPDLTVRVFLRGSTAVVALRVGQRPLHRRTYKVATGPGTLHPPLAAALTALAGPLDGATVLDPFCGDGTLAIEAALRWPSARVAASDIDPERVANTHANAARAGVDIAVARADAGDLGQRTPGVDLLLTNPPWNVSVSSQASLRSSLEGFWSTAADFLRLSGRTCTVTDSDLDVPTFLDSGGYRLGLCTRLRVAGRIVHVVLAGGPGGQVPALSPELESWRGEAIRAGVVTEHGF